MIDYIVYEFSMKYKIIITFSLSYDTFLAKIF